MVNVKISSVTLLADGTLVQGVVRQVADPTGLWCEAFIPAEDLVGLAGAALDTALVAALRDAWAAAMTTAGEAMSIIGQNVEVSPNPS